MCEAEVELVSKGWATESSLLMQTPGLLVEYSFYGVSLQKSPAVRRW